MKCSKRMIHTILLLFFLFLFYLFTYEINMEVHEKAIRVLLYDSFDMEMASILKSKYNDVTICNRTFERDFCLHIEIKLKKMDQAFEMAKEVHRIKLRSKMLSEHVLYIRIIGIEDNCEITLIFPNSDGYQGRNRPHFYLLR